MCWWFQPMPNVEFSHETGSFLHHEEIPNYPTHPISRTWPKLGWLSQVVMDNGEKYRNTCFWNQQSVLLGLISHISWKFPCFSVTTCHKPTNHSLNHCQPWNVWTWESRHESDRWKLIGVSLKLWCVPKLLGSQHSNIGSKFMPIWWCGKSPPLQAHTSTMICSIPYRLIIKQISQKLAPWANKNGFVWRQIFRPTPFFSSTSPSYRCSKLHPTTLGGSAPNQVDALVKLPIWGKPWRSWDGGKIHRPIV
jgi:hypothetical protein